MTPDSGPPERVLVVVPCLNEERHLPTLLPQLLADSGDMLIVVADGGSRDASRRIVGELAARHDNLVLLDNPARLQSAAVNLAVARYGAQARWVVRVDAHCGYPDRYMSGLVAAAATRDVVSIVVPMVTQGVECFQRAAAAAQNSVIGTGGSAHRHLGTGRYVEHGHHALMRIDAFTAVGGYDEAMSHNEDAELDHRLGRIGRIWLEPSLAIAYFPRRTPGALWRQYLGYGTGRAQTLTMHGIRPRLRQMIPVAPPLAALLALLTPLSPLLALPLLIWLLVTLACGVAIGWRERSRCAALSGVAAAIMHIAWGTGFLRQILFGRIPRRD